MRLLDGNKRGLARTGWLAFGVLVLSVAAAGLVQHACTEAFPFAQPSAGTPRAGYCEAIDGYSPWLPWILGPTALMIAGGLLLRSHRWMPYLLASGLIALAIANSIIAGNLGYDAFEGG